MRRSVSRIIESIMGIMGLNNAFPFADFRWFLLLAEKENISLVAAELFISQPALSRNLANLETSLGVKLFDRVGKKVFLNSHGHIAYEYLSKISLELQTLTQLIRENAQLVSQQVTLGFMSSFAANIIPAITEKFLSYAPDIKLSLMVVPRENIENTISSGKADIALIARIPQKDIDPEKFHWDYLATQKLGLAVPQGHELSHITEISIAELTSYPIILPPPKYVIREIIEDICSQNNVHLHTIMESGDSAIIKKFIILGRGLSIVPLEPTLADQQDNLCYIPISDPLAYREVGIIYSTQRPLSGAVKKLIEFILLKNTESHLL